MDGRPGGLNSGVKFGLGIGRADEFVQEDRCHSPGVFAVRGFSSTYLDYSSSTVSRYVIIFLLPSQAAFCLAVWVGKNCWVLYRVPAVMGHTSL